MRVNISDLLGLIRLGDWEGETDWETGERRQTGRLGRGDRLGDWEEETDGETGEMGRGQKGGEEERGGGEGERKGKRKRGGERGGGKGGKVMLLPMGPELP